MKINDLRLSAEAHAFLAKLSLPQQQQVAKWWQLGYTRTYCEKNGVVAVARLSGVRSERVVVIKQDGSITKEFNRA